VAKEDRGFASMDRSKQREIASKGGKAAHQKGTAHEWTSEEARDAGRKGGIASHRRRREMLGSTENTGAAAGSDASRGTNADDTRASARDESSSSSSWSSSERMSGSSDRSGSSSERMGGSSDRLDGSSRSDDER
jgi:uncharacterized protein